MAKLKSLPPRLTPMHTKPIGGQTHQPKQTWGNGRGGRPWRRKRQYIFARDLYTCQICQRVGGDLELDHIVNAAIGGNDNDENLQTLCKSCHATKTQAESQQ